MQTASRLRRAAADGSASEYDLNNFSHGLLLRRFGERPGIVYSHSIVPGGLLVMSNTQRFTPLTSLTIRLASFSSRSNGSFTQSAVIPSCDSTARMAMV